MLVIKPWPLKIISVAFVLAIIYFFPWQHLNWGKIQFQPAATITVTGSATQAQKNEVASFSVGVEIDDQDKQTAVDQANQNSNQILTKLKEFGIAAEDLQTENVSIYQFEDRPEPWLSSGTGRTEKKWRASTTISLKLRAINRSEELTNLLSQLPATHVSGPSFQLDEDGDYQTNLLAAAVKNAQEKAAKLAAQSGRKLGQVITIDETGSTRNDYPVYKAMGASLAADELQLEPGSTQVSQNVVVVFELK